MAPYIESVAGLRDCLYRRACLGAALAMLQAANSNTLARRVALEHGKLTQAIHDFITANMIVGVRWADESARVAAWDGALALLRGAVSECHYAVACAKHRCGWPRRALVDCDRCVATMAAALKICEMIEPP